MRIHRASVRQVTPRSSATAFWVSAGGGATHGFEGLPFQLRALSPRGGHGVHGTRRAAESARRAQALGGANDPRGPNPQPGPPCPCFRRARTVADAR